MTLRIAPTAAQSLERSKPALLMAIDVPRASLRVLSAELTAAGRLDHPEDAVHLFVDELLDLSERDIRTIVHSRRSAHERHCSVEIAATTWEGDPLTKPFEEAEFAPVSEVTGHGTSAGIVEGPVRIVLDADADSTSSPAISWSAPSPTRAGSR